jgi:hypothetical protein
MEVSGNGNARANFFLKKNPSNRNKARICLDKGEEKVFPSFTTQSGESLH